ncbi:unnamed protein product, partial [Vitis vinifera]
MVVSHQMLLYFAPLGTLSKFLCRLHLNEPGCVVGEQRHGLVAGWVCFYRFLGLVVNFLTFSFNPIFNFIKCLLLFEY